MTVRLRNNLKRKELKMRVSVKVYDGVKYEKNSKVIAKTEYEISSYEVKEIPASEILREFDETDEYDEYLILTLKNGETATFRNSRVDLFRA